MSEKTEKNKSLNESIADIRVSLQNANLKKSGKNKYAGFEYFELADFLPTLNKLMSDNGVNDRFSIEDDKAILELIKGEEKQGYTIPFVMFPTPLNSKGSPSMQDIQYLGALNTYYKRYLYLNAFGITDGDVIDALDNTDIAPAKRSTAKASERANASQVSEIRNLARQYGSEEYQICAAFKIDALEEMTVADYQRAKDIFARKA